MGYPTPAVYGIGIAPPLRGTYGGAPLPSMLSTDIKFTTTGPVTYPVSVTLPPPIAAYTQVPLQIPTTQIAQATSAYIAAAQQLQAQPIPGVSFGIAVPADTPQAAALLALTPVPSYPTYSYYAVMADGTSNFIGTGTSSTYQGPNIGGAVAYRSVQN